MTAAATPDWLVIDGLAPSVHGQLAPLYEAAADGAVAMPFCGTCDEPLELEQVLCHRCDTGAPEWRTVEPTGTVHAVTTVHRLERGLLRTDSPYHVIDVELASLHRIVVTTVEAAEEAPRIGDRVAIAFRHLGGVAIPAATTIHAATTIPAATTIHATPRTAPIQDTETSP